MSPTVCVFEGDDAAAEAVRPMVDALEALETDITFVTPSVDDHAKALQNGTVPDSIRASIDRADTVLFGAGSTTHQQILRYLRWGYGGGTYANVRPIRSLPGAQSPLGSPEDIDYVIIRENLEGVYFRAEGDIANLAEAMPDLEGAGGQTVGDLGAGKFAVRTATEAHLEAFGATACEIAAERADGDRTTVTCATKSNVLPETDGLFARSIERAVRDYESLTYEHIHADDAAQRLVTDPDRFDVIVTPNFAGDLLSDLGAGTIGGLGVAPSACYGDDVAYFEPVHGTAPDISGKNEINPTAMLRTAVMMLEYLERDADSRRLRRAIEDVYRETTIRTRDLGGSASTTTFVDAVVDRL